MASYRTDVLRYLTSRPGEVVYRSDIAADVGITSRQVTSCIYNVMRGDDALSDEIQVVISGNAWRYVPTTRPVSTSPETPDRSVNGATRPAVSTITVPVAVAPRRSPTKSANRIFEEIGESQDGTIIIQESETGALYRANLI